MQSETQIEDFSRQLEIAKASYTARMLETALSRQKNLEVQLVEEQERSKILSDQVAEVPYCPHPVFSTPLLMNPTHHGVLRVLKGS